MIHIFLLHSICIVTIVWLLEIEAKAMQEEISFAGDVGLREVM